MAETLQMSSSQDQIPIEMSQINTNGHPGMISSLRTPTTGVVLSFRNISYREKEKSGFLLHQKTVETEILSNISGIMKPGLNAIMGPGAGKSSLLHVLAARKDPSGLSGDVLINGEPQSANFKCISGYVAQDDFVMRVLTVRENIQFSAALRLPTTMGEDEKNEWIDRVIEELGLNEVADSRVLSREKRKMTSIGMELVTDPSILFLDEPTTGLDLRAANAVLLHLKRMSRQGRTIIFSIHPPQHSIFKLFDSLTLLASGKLMFHGPAQRALEYFASAGYQCEPYNNPADFFLEVINGDVSAVVLNREEDLNEANENEELYTEEDSVIENLAEFYVNSSFYGETNAELYQLSEDQENRRLAFQEISCVTSFCHQFRWITWRSFRNYLAFPRVTMIQSLITAILGLMVGFTFRGLKNNCNEIQNRAGLLYLLTVFQCITSVSAGELFVLQKKFFLHEHSSGYYRVSSYFFGKLTAEFIPRRLLPTVIFVLLLYISTGWKTSAGSFCTMVFTVLILAYSASSLPLSLGAGENAVAVPTLLVTIYFVFMLFFSGLSLYFGTSVPWLSWLQYLNIPHYGFTALQHNEFWGQNFCPDVNATESISCQSYVICTGEEFLTIQGIDLSPWGLWRNHVILTAIMTFFLIITYLQLLLLKNNLVFLLI